MSELITNPLYSDADLVSYWQMENNLLDSKGSNHLNNESVEFDDIDDVKYGAHGLFGTNIYGYIDGATTLDFTTGFTLATWVFAHTTQNAGGTGLLAKQGAGFSGYMLWFLPDFRIVNYVNGGIRAITTDTVPIDTWTHVATTWDGTTSKCYINGVEKATASYAVAPTSSGHRFWVGRYYDTWYLNGYMDDTCAFKRALTPTELLSLTNEAPTTNLKSVSTIAYAGIKNIDTVAIASVKNMNGVA